jgi:hypothetical protein
MAFAAAILASKDLRIAVGRVLVLGSLAVMVLHAGAVLGRITIRPESGVLADVLALLDAGEERSLAAWWTGGLLFAAALASALLALLAAGLPGLKWESRAWWVMTFVFALLSFDESVSLHERGARWTAAVLDADSPLAKLGWILPGAALVMLGVIVLIPAFRALPRRPRTLVIAGLATSIVGAVGMEFAYVMLVDAQVAWRWVYLVMAIEEAAEIAGVLVVLAGISMALQVAGSSGRLTLQYHSRDPLAETARGTEATVSDVLRSK